MKWTEIQIKTTTKAEEMVINTMYDLGITGLAIEDPKDIIAFQQSEKDWDFIDSHLIKLNYEEVIIKGYLPESEDLIDKIELIRENIEKTPFKGLGESLGEVTIAEVYEKDWAEAWKKYYKPIRVGEKVVIKPTWEEYNGKDGDIIVEMDPGMAFGTGTHETTAMCIEFLEKYVKENDIVYDIGCGSGILSILAAKLGAKNTIGVDFDELCIKVAKENVKLNKVNDLVQIKHGNLLDVVHEKAHIIVSNIIAETIVHIIDSIEDYLKENGIFIASGIIVSKSDLVKETLTNNGFKIIDTKIMGEWVSIASIKE